MKTAGLQVTAHIMIILLASLVLLYFGQDFLIPLVLGIMAWSLLNALADHIGRLPIGASHMPRWLAMLVSMILLLATLLLIYQILASQALAIEAAVPVYQENFIRLFNDLVTHFGIEELPTTDTLLNNIDFTMLLSWLGGSMGYLVSTLILILMYTAFLFSEQRVMMKKINALAGDPEKAAKMYRIISEIGARIQNYVWIKTVVSMATGLLSYIILSLVGVDFAAIWALLIFMLNYIPNIGSILGVAMPAVLTLMQFDSLTPFLITTIGLGGVQFCIGNLVEPALMGKSLNLSPFMIILSLTFWGLLWGIPGMFLSVPITVMFAIVCARFEPTRGLAIILSGDGNVTEEDEPASA